jgi:SnoaL-like domain
MEESLRIAIETACQRLCYAFCTHGDANDIDRYTALFVADARFSRPGRVLRSASEISDALRARPASTIVRHLCMNPQIEVLNETHARGRGHLLVLRHHSDSGITEPTVCADYRDEYVRLGPEWRFAVRDVELAFGDTATQVVPR